MNVKKLAELEKQFQLSLIEDRELNRADMGHHMKLLQGTGTRMSDLIRYVSECSYKMGEGFRLRAELSKKISELWEEAEAEAEALGELEE